MKIDNRVFIIPGMPVALLLLFRFMFFLGGVEWEADAGVISSIAIYGLVIGAVAFCLIYIAGYKLGYLKVGKQD